MSFSCFVLSMFKYTVSDILRIVFSYVFGVVLSEIYRGRVVGYMFRSPTVSREQTMLSGPGGLEDTATLGVLLVCLLVEGCLGLLQAPRSRPCCLLLEYWRAPLHLVSCWSICWWKGVMVYLFVIRVSRSPPGLPEAEHIVWSGRTGGHRYT